MTSTATRRELMRMIGVEYGRELAHMSLPFLGALASWWVLDWYCNRRR